MAGGAFLLWAGRDQWFYGDEWAFLADRVVSGDLALLTPHNEHWSTVPVLAYRALFGLAGVGSYVPYLTLLILAHLAAVHLLWRVALRSGVHPWVATAGVAAFVPFGPGADNLLWAFQIGFVGSLALGLGHTLMAGSPGPFGRRDAAGWGIAVLALMSSGIGVVTAAVAAVTAWLRRGWRLFLATASVPAAVYLLWLVLAGEPGLETHPAPTGESLRLLPAFVGRGLWNVLAWGTPWPVVGVVAGVAGITAVVWRLRVGEEIPAPAIACAAGAVLLFAVVGVGRTTFGFRFADASRYLYLGGALLLPLALVGLSEPVRWTRLGAGALAVLLLGWGANNARLLLEAADRQAEREREIGEQLVAALQLRDAGAILLAETPEPLKTPNLQMAELAALRPSLPDDRSPPPDARLRAALALQVAVTPVPRFPAGDLGAVRAFHSTLSPAGRGCRDVTPAGRTPRLRLPAGQASWEVRSSPGASLGLLAAEGAVRPRYVVPVTVPEGPGFLSSALEDATLTVRFTAPLRICRPS